MDHKTRADRRNREINLGRHGSFGHVNDTQQSSSRSPTKHQKTKDPVLSWLQQITLSSREEEHRQISPPRENAAHVKIRRAHGLAGPGISARLPIPPQLSKPSLARLDDTTPPLRRRDRESSRKRSASLHSLTNNGNLSDTQQSSSSSSVEQRNAEVFEKRPRRKTRADRYTIDNKVPREKKYNKRHDLKSTRKRAVKRQRLRENREVMTEFISSAVQSDRVSMKPNLRSGLFLNGRSSDTKDVTDLTFSQSTSTPFQALEADGSREDDTGSCRESKSKRKRSGISTQLIRDTTPSKTPTQQNRTASSNNPTQEKSTVSCALAYKEASTMCGPSVPSSPRTEPLQPDIQPGPSSIQDANAVISPDSTITGADTVTQPCKGESAVFVGNSYPCPPQATILEKDSQYFQGTHPTKTFKNNITLDVSAETLAPCAARENYVDKAIMTDSSSTIGDSNPGRVDSRRNLSPPSRSDKNAATDIPAGEERLREADDTSSAYPSEGEPPMLPFHVFTTTIDTPRASHSRVTASRGAYNNIHGTQGFSNQSAPPSEMWMGSFPADRSEEAPMWTRSNAEPQLQLDFDNYHINHGPDYETFNNHYLSQWWDEPNAPPTHVQACNPEENFHTRHRNCLAFERRESHPNETQSGEPYCNDDSCSKHETVQQFIERVELEALYGVRSTLLVENELVGSFDDTPEQETLRNNGQFESDHAGYLEPERLPYASYPAWRVPRYSEALRDGCYHSASPHHERAGFAGCSNSESTFRGFWKPHQLT